MGREHSLSGLGEGSLPSRCPCANGGVEHEVRAEISLHSCPPQAGQAGHFAQKGLKFVALERIGIGVVALEQGICSACFITAKTLRHEI